MSIRAFGRALPLAAVLTAGCENPTAPSKLPGLYSLTSVAGVSLPAVMSASEFHRLYVLTETIRLGADGTGRLTGVRESERLGTAVTTGRTRIQMDFEFTYRAIGMRIEITFRCPPNASCLKPPHLVGRQTHDGLRLAAPWEMDFPLDYVRVTIPLEHGS
jgi:hypothetical protein